MRTKLFLILIIFLSINLCRGQVTSNTLTNTEYNNIEVSGVLLSDIESTNGDFKEMRNLFGAANNIIETGSEIGELHRKFIYNANKNIEFKGLSLNQNPSIANLNVASITIKGITVNINDNIQILGENILKNKNTDGSYSLIFSKENGDCCVFVIEYNKETHLVDKIKYMELT